MKKGWTKERIDPSLAPLVVISLAGHVMVLALFLFLPSRGAAGEGPSYTVQQVDLVYADEIGGGVWGKPKRGPAHSGRITLPPPAPPVKAPSTKSSPAANVHERQKNAVHDRHNRRAGGDIPDPLRQAIEKLNEDRDGEYTRPGGDPNSARPGPAGPPGGNICAVYRSRASRLIRRTGSVPEAAGKSTTIAVVIGSGGGVTTKRVIRSSGVPHADTVALSLVPGTFGAPPPECGSVKLIVKVRFHGKSSSGIPAARSRRKRRVKRSNDAIQRALDDL